MLAAEGVRVRRRHFTLGPMDLHVSAGEYFVLLGPSGAGKTTLLEWLAGFHAGAAGELRLDGRVMSGASPRERNMGVVYQDAALFPHLDVRGNLAFPLRLRRQPPAAVDARVRELAELLRIEARLHAAPAELSHGEARRVALGRALAAGCRVLLLDEPLQGLDPALRRDLRLELAALHRRLGLTVLHITHGLAEARALATRVGVILAGRLEQVGTPDEVMAAPATAAVARYLMVPNYVEGVADGRGIVLPSGARLPAPVSSAGPVRGRFLGATLCERDGDGLVPVWVRGIEIHDGGARVVLGLSASGAPDADVFEVDAADAPSPLPEPGARAWLDLSGAHWHWS